MFGRSLVSRGEKKWRSKSSKTGGQEDIRRQKRVALTPDNMFQVLLTASLICSKYYPHLQDFDLVIVEPRLICLSCVRVREFPEKNQLVVDHLGITTSQILHPSNLVRGATLTITYSLGGCPYLSMSKYVIRYTGRGCSWFITILPWEGGGSTPPFPRTRVLPNLLQ